MNGGVANGGGASEPLVPLPLARDVGPWSSCARVWRLPTVRQGDGYRARSPGVRLEALETAAARAATGCATTSSPTFFCLPETLKNEARALDPGALLQPEDDDACRRFIVLFVEYLEFLGLPTELRARACIVAPASVATEIVVPFAGRSGARARDLPDAVAAPREPAAAEAWLCCNLSDVPARVALRAPAALVAPDEDATDSIAVSLAMGECLTGGRANVLGYVPDDAGQPTLWFECLLGEKRERAK